MYKSEHIKLEPIFKNYPYLSVKLTKVKCIREKLPEPLPWIEGF